MMIHLNNSRAFDLSSACQYFTIIAKLLLLFIILAPEDLRAVKNVNNTTNELVLRMI